MATQCICCGEKKESAFSRRMLARRSGKRCRVCVAAAEVEEQAAAASRYQGGAGGEELHQCSCCGKTKPAGSFSRSQLSQQHAERQRCLACVGAASQEAISDAAKQNPLLLTARAEESDSPTLCSAAGREFAQPRVDVEAMRLRKLKRLRRLLLKLCSERGFASPPVLAFDRWLQRSKLNESLDLIRHPSKGAGGKTDPLLPVSDSGVDGLVSDLSRGGRLSAHAARDVAAQLVEASRRAAAAVREQADNGAPAGASISWRGDVARLSESGRERPYVEVSGEHLRKLATLHAIATNASAHARPKHAADGHAGASAQPPSCAKLPSHQGKKGRLTAHSRRDGEKSASEFGSEQSSECTRVRDASPWICGPRAFEGTAAFSDMFLRRVLCLLLRYEALGGHGYQSAVERGAFEVLRDRCGVHAECFASPLNCTNTHYCSAFEDTDGCFGSLGSFFGLRPTHGSFEANPPFVPETMLAAVEHAESLLAEAQSRGDALSFAFVVPTWAQLPFHTRLRDSAWRRGELLVVGESEHGFVDGAQHMRPRAERLRASSFSTTVAFLQTATAASKWPFDTKVAGALTAALCAALPSEADAAARMQRGGDAVAQLLHRRKAKREADESTGARGESAAKDKRPKRG